jgi:hypothetical protein
MICLVYLIYTMLYYFEYDSKFQKDHIHYYARVTLKTYLPVKRIGNKFLK